MTPPPVLLHLKPRRERLDVVPCSPSVDGGVRFDSQALLRGSREILIQHAGEVYRLRHTRNDKLILTK